MGNALSDGIGGTAGAWLALIDIGSTPLHINDMIFNQSSDGPGRLAEEVPKAVRIAWYLVLVAALARDPTGHREPDDRLGCVRVHRGDTYCATQCVNPNLINASVTAGTHCDVLVVPADQDRNIAA